MSPAETHVATDPIEAWLTEAVERLVRAIDPSVSSSSAPSPRDRLVAAPISI
jgi:hypothetical protein